MGCDAVVLRDELVESFVISHLLQNLCFALPSVPRERFHLHKLLVALNEQKQDVRFPVDVEKVYPDTHKDCSNFGYFFLYFLYLPIKVLAFEEMLVLLVAVLK